MSAARRAGASPLWALTTVALMVVALMAIAAIPAAAQAALFVVTDPLRAQVEVDGVVIGSLTPLVLRDIAPGPHRILVRRNGFSSVVSRIDVLPGERRVLDLVLPPRSFAVEVFGEPGWQLDEDPVGAGLLRIPLGAYEADRKPDTALRVRPRYVRQRWIDALNILIPLLSGFSIALTASELTAPRVPGAPLSPFVLSTWLLDAASIGVDVALHLERQRFLDAFTAEPLAEDPSLARPLFEQAEQELAAGRFETALEDFTRLVDRHPDSPLAARALYTRARLFLILKKTDAAMADFMRFVTDVPLPSFYDRAQVQLAELSLEKGNPAECLSHIDALLFLDEAIEQEDVDWLRGRALLTAMKAGTTGADAAAEWLRGLVDRYPASPSIDEYRVNLAEALFDAGRRADAAAALGLITDTAQRGELADRIGQLRDQLGDSPAP